MTTRVRTVLMPYLIISYVFGLRIASLSNPTRLWFSAIYMLLIWSVYFTSCASKISIFKNYPIEVNICYVLEAFTNICLIVFAIYHDKKFHNCLKKLDIVDNTLLQLGTKTNYNKLRKKAVWFVLGWFVMVILLTYYAATNLKDKCDRNFAIVMCNIFLRDHLYHIHSIVDLTTACILEYTELKFDQVNEHLQKLIEDEGHEIKWVWKKKNSTIQSRQRRVSKPINSKCVMWIVTHLHLELRKICCEIDSIFLTQMTIKMACYFGWIALDLREILYAILIDGYAKSKIIVNILHWLWFFYDISKVLLINCMCEKVITKASVTADLLNKLSYFTRDVEIREIIKQFSFRIVYAPLRFYGIGFFQFGFKFLYGYITSIATVLVIIIQAQANK